MKTTTFLLLTDEHGRILGATKKGNSDIKTKQASSAGIKPLSGQAIHEVEVPDSELNWHKTPEVYEWSRRHYVRLNNQKSELRPIMELLEKVPNLNHSLYSVTDLPETPQGK